MPEVPGVQMQGQISTRASIFKVTATKMTSVENLSQPSYHLHCLVHVLVYGSCWEMPRRLVSPRMQFVSQNSPSEEERGGGGKDARHNHFISPCAAPTSLCGHFSAELAWQLLICLQDVSLFQVIDRVVVARVRKKKGQSRVSAHHKLPVNHGLCTSEGVVDACLLDPNS